MEFNFKDKNQLVDDVIFRLMEVFPPQTDFTVGTPLRNIIESLMEETDFQYWQLQQVYESGFIDTVTDDDIDKLVALLGITRFDAQASIGEVTFGRTTNGTDDYYIPAGTIVETLPNSLGEKAQFTTTKDAVLLKENLEVNAPVECNTPGISGNVAANTVRTINNPPVGIEYVINKNAITGGEERETLEELRERTKKAIYASGTSTEDGIMAKIRDIPGIREVSVTDMARGIGTANVYVLADTVPMTPTIRTEVEVAIEKIKAAGIDIILQEPEVLKPDFNITLYLYPGYEIINVRDTIVDAVTKHITSFDIGQELILSQIQKIILNSSDKIRDIRINEPLTNIEPTMTQIIRPGIITLIKGD